MPYKRFPEFVGNRLIGLLEECGEITFLALAALKRVKTASVRLTIDQMVKIGVDSLPLALITSTFIGMVFAMQIASEFVRFGAGKFVGGVMAIAMTRELGPAVTGIVVAARVAASIAAELGTMKVTEQIDALQALGVSPVKYLVVPRLVATIIMLPLLTILTIVVGFYGGFWVAVIVGKINGVQYFETAQSLTKMWDIYGGLIKTAIFGAIIAVVACHKGLTTKGGAKGVGEATTSAVVATLISLFIVNYFLSMAFFK
ncbi:ABC transporter permease [Candidatus Saganbacteria bacterium]|nr:ABC transporter permease [Candidatus Saganbacteria bacterium]